MLRILLASLPLSLLVALGGCTTDPVTLVNPQTGEKVQCGPYLQGGWDGGRRVVGLERGCIRDFQGQGYQRVSG